MKPWRAIQGKKIAHSRRLPKVSLGARNHYKTLIVFADDDGRLESDSFLLKGTCYPREHDIKPAMIEKWNNELAGQELILCYEVDGEAFIAIPNYRDRQGLRNDRYKPSLLPEPQCQPSDNQMSTRCQPDDNPRYRLDKIRGDKRTDLSIPFSLVYNTYNKKVGKVKAFEAFGKAFKSQEREANEFAVFLVNNIKRQDAERKRLHEAGQFVAAKPDLERWIKNKRWDDTFTLDPSATSSGGNGNQQPPDMVNVRWAVDELCKQDKPLDAVKRAIETSPILKLKTDDEKEAALKMYCDRVGVTG